MNSLSQCFFLIFLRYIVTCHYVNLLRIIEERKIKIGSKNKITLNIYKYIFNKLKICKLYLLDM